MVAPSPVRNTRFDVRLELSRRFRKALMRFQELRSLAAFLGRVPRLVHSHLDDYRRPSFPPWEFPAQGRVGNVFGKGFQLCGSPETFFTQAYQERWLPKFPYRIQTRLLKTETVAGERVSPGNTFRTRHQARFHLPVALNAPSVECAGRDKIKARVGSHKYVLGGLGYNRYHYLPFPADEDVELCAEDEIIVGRPILNEQLQVTELDLVLVIFLDGFASRLLDLVPLETSMPRTAEFFSRGARFTGCHAAAEWTLPGVASIFSGKRPRDHGVFHPYRQTQLGDYPILSECFQAAGYHTFQVCGNWRKTPLNGYARGFDRTVYGQSLSSAEVVGEVVEQLQAFPHRAKFGWATFFDFHHDLRGLAEFSSRLNLSLPAHNYPAKERKSVSAGYDELAIERLIAKAGNLDCYLGLIYDRLLRDFDQQRILVALVSDHGQAYLGKDPGLLSEQRIRVPLMLRGKGVPQGVFEELVQNSDVPAILTHLAGLEWASKIDDSRVPEALGGAEAREYVFSEALYPGQTYKAVVKTKHCRLDFESEGLVDNEGKFALGAFSSELKLGDLAATPEPNAHKVMTDFVLRHLQERQPPQ